MRGQFTIEFTLAAVSFIVLMVYVMTFVNKEVPMFSSQHMSNEIKARTFQISEMLIFDDGDWDGMPTDPINPSNPARIGLSSGYHILNKTKIGYLNDLCLTEDGYKKILSLLNINTHFTIEQYSGFRSFMVSENRCLDLLVKSSSLKLLACPPEGSENWECMDKLTEGVTKRHQMVRYAPDEDADVINITVGVW